MRGSTLCVTEYGAAPDAEADAAPAIQRALAACRERRANVLRLPPGRYHLRPRAAATLLEELLAGVHGANPEPAIFRPNHRYPVGLDLTGMAACRIEAAGATLLCHGFMEPLSLVGCRDLTIHGLTIDYARLPYSLGAVVQAGESGYTVRFDPEFGDVRPGMAWPRGLLADEHTGRLLPQRLGGGDSQAVGERTLRVARPAGPARAGMRIAVCHTLHYRPAVLVRECRGVTLDGVTIHAQPGMGVVAHRSHDLTLRRLRVAPREGGFVSTNTDATHCTALTGTLSYEDCRFSGHGDDAANVHGYYHTISAPQGRRCTLTLDAPTGTHAQALDYPDAGSLLELVARDTLATVRTYRVLEVRPDPERWCSHLLLDDDLPEDPARYFLTDVTRLPRVVMRGCHMSDHIARGALIKTRGVRIESCTFERCGGTAIHVAPEAWWREAGSSRAVTIRGNRFLACGQGDGTRHGACAIAVEVDAERTDVPDVHRDLCIESNTIAGDEAACGIYLSGVTGVRVRHNAITGCREPVRIQNCREVEGASG